MNKTCHGTPACEAPLPLATTTSEADLEWFAAACKALGHPVRVRILAHLKAMDRCLCGAIVDMLPLAQSTVSQHLKQLKDAGLIKGSVDGPKICYCVDRHALARFETLARSL
ncbi:MAG: ArsR/SmtB family transcription factor [Desulfovibrionaceae bacterium]